MKTYSTASEVDAQLEIAARWRPYLDAVGCDTRGWSPSEIYELSALVWRNSEVFERRAAKTYEWHQQPRTYTSNLLDMVPPERLLLEAIRELPDAIKKEIRAKIQATRKP
jgi:hypothetical protein